MAHARYDESAASIVSTSIIDTIGSGLTKTVTTLSNDLTTGKTTGQTVKGGTNSGGALTLTSTAHATKGTITAGPLALDEANGNGKITGIDGTTVSVFDIQGNTTGALYGTPFLQRWIAPQQPVGTDPQMYVAADGSLYARTALIVSGYTSGTGSTYQILTPDQLAGNLPYSEGMVMVKCDLAANASCIVTQSNSNGNYHVTSLDRSGNITFQVSEYGLIAVGKKIPASVLDAEAASPQVILKHTTGGNTYKGRLASNSTGVFLGHNCNPLTATRDDTAADGSYLQYNGTVAQLDLVNVSTANGILVFLSASAYNSGSDGLTGLSILANTSGGNVLKQIKLNAASGGKRTLYIDA